MPLKMNQWAVGFLGHLDHLIIWLMITAISVIRGLFHFPIRWRSFLRLLVSIRLWGLHILLHVSGRGGAKLQASNTPTDVDDTLCFWRLQDPGVVKRIKPAAKTTRGSNPRSTTGRLCGKQQLAVARLATTSDLLGPYMVLNNSKSQGHGWRSSPPVQ